MNKAVEAFRTIGEVADELDVPKHVLRFWEGKFPHIRPMKRGGGRRYYRPEDMELLRGIRHLLHAEGYTIKGVQKILREQGIDQVKEAAVAATKALVRDNRGAKARGRRDGRSDAQSEVNKVPTADPVDRADPAGLGRAPAELAGSVSVIEKSDSSAGKRGAKRDIINQAIRELEQCLEILAASAPPASVATRHRASRS